MGAPLSEPLAADRSDWLSRHGLAALLGLTAATYISALGAGFVWDDYPLIVDNPRLDALSNIPSYFRQDMWAGVVDGGSGYYRPLFLTWLALLHVGTGGSAAVLHLGGLLWHGLAVAAVHRVLARLVSPRAALLGGLIFAVHPAQSEAVVWISAHNDPMAAALGLWALAWVLPVDVSRARCVGAAALAAAAVLTKESAVLLPLFLLLVDGVAATRARPGRVLALCGGVGLALLLRVSADVGGTADDLADHARYLVSVAPALALTLGALVVAPWPLSVARSVRWLELDTPHTVAGLIFWVAVLFALFWPSPRRRLVRVGLAWAALALAPAGLALLLNGRIGERFLYLPMAGLALSAGACLGGLRPRWWVAPGLAWVLATSLRLPDWASRYSILEAALRDTPNPFVHTLYADALLRYGDPGLALAHYRLALVGEPPEGLACEPGMELAFRGGRLDIAREMGQASLDQGCGQFPTFVASYATALAEADQWQAAAALLARMPGPDPTGRAEALRARLAARQAAAPSEGEFPP